MDGKTRSGLTFAGWIIASPFAVAAALLAANLILGLSKDIDTWRPPEGLRVDASHLDPIHVDRIVNVSPDTQEALGQLRKALEIARAQGLKIAISGARHTMGGHTAYPEGIVLDMLAHKNLKLDSSAGPDGMRVILHAQAGARWSEIIPYLDAHGYAVKIMQSNNPFTIGGTMSVNAHGWQHNEPPFGSTVDGFRLFTPDGQVRYCSRTVNTELFKAAIGGYGLFGVVMDVDLRVVPNRIYRAERFRFDSDEYPRKYHALVDGDTTLGLVYGRLSSAPGSFLEKTLLTRYVALGGKAPNLPEATGDGGILARIKHLFFLASVGNGFGKEMRWILERIMGGESAAVATRNQILNDPIDLFENRDSTRTQLLHEYFIPRDSLEPFLVRARTIIPAHGGDLLNVTIRSLRADGDSYLPYAREDVFSLVMLFSQSTTPEADAVMAGMTRLMIDAALASGGTYYLPYRPHASAEQFKRAYPMASAFFALKRKYDPGELFQNRFYRDYGNLADTVAPE